ncbi:MAG: hypothetical protein ABR598_05200 [Candidatus Dormibacteria bacterium]
MSNAVLAPLLIAVAATVTGVLVPARSRWSWALAAGGVSLAVVADAGILPAAALLTGVAVATAAEGQSARLVLDFNGILGRLAALALGVFTALVVLVRFSSLDVGANLHVLCLLTLGLVAGLFVMVRPGPAAEARAARLVVAVAAAGWALTGHRGVAAAAAASLAMVVLAVVARPLALHGKRLAGAANARTTVLMGALVVTAILLLVLPGGVLGIGDVPVSLNGLARPAAWMVVWSLAASLLASAALRERLATSSLLVACVALSLVVVRFPVAQVGVMLIAAIAVPRLAPGRSAAAWSRVLVVGAAGIAAVLAAGFGARQHGDEALVTVLVLGFVAAAGMYPFGIHVVRWMEAAPPALAAMVSSTLLASVLAALVAAEPALAAAHGGPRLGLVLGLFGGLTAILGGLHAMNATDWRGLALRTTPCEVGLALVGVASFDTRGLQGAALCLAVLAVTRPVLLYADALGPRRGAGLVLTALALLTAAGLPPTLGFPARVLVLGAATRVSPVVGAVAVAGTVLEVMAIAVVLRRRLALPGGGVAPANTHAVTALTAATALVVLAGGLFPAALLGTVFQVGG